VFFLPFQVGIPTWIGRASEIQVGILKIQVGFSGKVGILKFQVGFFVWLFIQIHQKLRWNQLCWHQKSKIFACGGLSLFFIHFKINLGGGKNFNRKVVTLYRGKLGKGWGSPEGRNFFEGFFSFSYLNWKVKKNTDDRYRYCSTCVS